MTNRRRVNPLSILARLCSRCGWHYYAHIGHACLVERRVKRG